ncbi:S-adenosyl-L-methionine-dependent methyltransferase [Glarea lozoyensis ATCC 20868]|uniref:S-adenosyl-L-methionine-dependent methyltransferase n=1 Tax=Glarea lozoyensis (strain ATCC 20868 / MF5171) TaxID=1116229 RepID=S3DMR2_GLAL2|nr:S-adenosyl-L-methionine-dependent methyltransferase [Glarea lozoyensis ATCC 20868]EPE33376.1 S-adenosyl-L-methionine-dependent methyltransferase [Glarea lozoyensis ATCC 20868]
MSDTIKDVSVRLLFPIYFMMVAGTYIPRTIVSLISSGQFGTLCSPSAFKDAWFARFWGVYGPLIRQNNSTVVAPLIDQARGIVLDIGPGSGEWLSLFNKENVTKIYGVEPNVDHHPRLREKIVQAGLQDKYVIIPVGIEDLGEGWVQKGSVDSVVTVLCLCSIPTPEYVISELYQYMREGGIWIIYEHVKTKEGALMTTYQCELLFSIHQF